MTDFSSWTAFRLVRRIATVSRGTPSLYLLISDTPGFGAFLSDLEAELSVQAEVDLHVVAASEIQPGRLAEAFDRAAGAVTVVTFDRWLQRLVSALDRSVILLTTTGAILLLTSPEIAERMLIAAPNLRNRLTDVLNVKPDEAFGGAGA